MRAVIYVAEISPSISDEEVLREANDRRALLVALCARNQWPCAHRTFMSGHRETPRRYWFYGVA